ncbi:MAG: L,D-transpeptidase [Myxococcales bacterium]|nr:L,D-transpeptidase [Myxococcales bacterium]
MLLVGPDLAAWSPTPPKVLLPEMTPHDKARYPLFAMARQHDSPVYQASKRRYGRGVLRYGAYTRARRVGAGSRCPGGNWYELLYGGYICNTRGFDVYERRPGIPGDTTPARAFRPLPYRYAKAPDGAVRFTRPPSADELAKVTTSDDPNQYSVVADRMDGIYFLALTEHEETRDDVTYLRTVQGHYVQEDILDVKSVPQMHGEPIIPAQPLPIAFVYGEETATLYWVEDGELVEAGEAHKHARLSVKTLQKFGNRTYWVTSDGLAIPADRVRIAAPIQPPSGMRRGERWIHVNLSQQTLVAYSGAEAVYATLVSSGKEGYDTPTGEFRVLHKYISTTMKGPDPDAGYYYIEEVPWTQYYSGSFALHGAFWHNDFGRVRSHGCTNLAPTDARWLYYFTKPHVPPRWHGLRKQGTRIVITD